MTSRRRVVALVSTLASVLLLTLVATGPTSARTVDERCVSGDRIAAADLARASATGCSLVGRIVYRGRVSVVVPPLGVSVAGAGVSTHGDVLGLRVTNTGGSVTATSRRVPSAGAGSGTGAGAAGARATSPPACRDRTFNLEGHAWHTPYRYRLNLGKMPHRFSTATVVRQVRAANHQMRVGANTCGRPRIDTPAAHYLGRTSVRANIKTTGSTVGCGTFNSTNVVAFGNLPGDLLGWTCLWWVSGGRIAAADVMMDSGDALTTHVPAGCVNLWDFEGALTHEMGHVYGLAHTGSGHANLTMQHLLRPCSTYARTLGLGDWLGMKKLYGVR